MNYLLHPKIGRENYTSESHTKYESSIFNMFKRNMDGYSKNEAFEKNDWNILALAQLYLK